MIEWPRSNIKTTLDSGYSWSSIHVGYVQLIPVTHIKCSKHFFLYCSVSNHTRCQSSTTSSKIWTGKKLTPIANGQLVHMCVFNVFYLVWLSCYFSFVVVKFHCFNGIFNQTSYVRVTLLGQFQTRVEPKSKAKYM